MDLTSPIPKLLYKIYTPFTDIDGMTLDRSRNCLWVSCRSRHLGKIDLACKALDACSKLELTGRHLFFAEGLTFASDSNYLYVVDSVGDNIKKVSTITGEVDLLTKTGLPNRSQTKYAENMIYNHITNQLYVNDNRNNEIRVISLVEDRAYTLYPMAHANETQTPNKLYGPTGMALDDECKYLFVLNIDESIVKISLLNPEQPAEFWKGPTPQYAQWPYYLVIDERRNRLYFSRKGCLMGIQLRSDRLRF